MRHIFSKSKIIIKNVNTLEIRYGGLYLHPSFFGQRFRITLSALGREDLRYASLTRMRPWSSGPRVQMVAGKNNNKCRPNMQFRPALGCHMRVPFFKLMQRDLLLCISLGSHAVIVCVITTAQTDHEVVHACISHYRRSHIQPS